MSANKNIEKICVIITAITLLIAFVFCNGQSLGVQISAHTIGYENRIFDNSKVHKLDIVMNDWDGFIEGCESEEYTSCNVSIDGELIRNVGIRAKGNTSLSSVKNMDSSRYSFKIEFDQYDSTRSYHGLDKLCLNNIIQDNTFMKDYVAYTLMNEFGADSPLCSYVYITVNGKDWGLYLAVEAIEDSFLKRNYGNNPGDLYKPDSMSFGGGPGNGKDFDFSQFSGNNNSSDGDQMQSDSSQMFGDNGDFDPSQMFRGNEDFDPSQMFGDNGDFDPSQMFRGNEDFDPSQMFGGGDFTPQQMPGKDRGGFQGGGFGGMGNSDVKLKYTDDSFESYSNIFNNAKTTVTDADKTRLINTLKLLSDYQNLESVVNTEEVLRYFVVHNFLVNGDSYTGQMIHNYYLYEKDGQLSMIPWDYNLAYGSFMGGANSSSVNDPIDTPVSGGMDDRPMVGWIFSDEKYTEQYHKLFNEFISETDIQSLISRTAEMIDKYVSKDPTKFCTYEDFQKGVTAISEFCRLRTESIKGQLNGTIPSTSEGQKADSSSLIDASTLNSSDLGSMGGGFGGGGKPDRTGGQASSGSFSKDAVSMKMMSNIQLTDNSSARSEDNKSGNFGGRMPNDFDPSQMPNGQMPDGFNPSQMPNGQMPDGFNPSQMPNGQMPDGFNPSQMPNGQMPDGFDPSQMPNGQMPDGFDPSQMQDGQTEEKSTEDTDDKSSESEKRSDSGFSKRPDSQNKFGGNFSGMNTNSNSSTVNYVTWILLGASSLVLISGLIFAFKFKK